VSLQKLSCGSIRLQSVFVSMFFAESVLVCILKIGARNFLAVVVAAHGCSWLLIAVGVQWPVE
jgi:hypothetical protein